MARDEARNQELRNSIAEGENIIRYRRSATGRKMNAEEIIAVKLSVESAKNKILRGIT